MDRERKEIRTAIWFEIFVWVIAFGLIALILWCTSCATRADISPPVRAALVNAETQLQDVQARVATIENRIGDIAITTKIGGNGDNVTSWILAASLGAAAFYPLVWRPFVRYTGLRKYEKE